jgi:hypothetical protein
MPGEITVRLVRIVQIVATLLCAITFVTTDGRAQEPATQTIVLEGAITRADHQTYVELPFEAPPGVERVTVDFEDDRDNRTVIDLGIYDPRGFRGWSGGNKSRFTIASSDATPSYVPGPIPAGTWRLLLGVPNIRDGSKSRYRAVITLEGVNAPAAESAFFVGPIREGAGWYRGDFHSHTAHSDGSCNSLSGRRVPCPAFRTLEAARRASLDFIAVTDHNSASHHAVLRELQAYYDTMLIIPGREITTFYGHMNVFGPTGPLDFQLGSPRLPNINRLFDQVEAQGGLASINHPGMPSGEACMGCGWVAPGTDFSRLAAVEIANGGTMHLTKTADGQFSHIPFWDGLLNKGYRVVGIGGSDSHDPDAPINRQSPVGKPTTVIYAQALSQRAIFEGLRSGRVFVDLEGDPSRFLDLSLEGAEGRADMGAALRLSRREQGLLSIKVRGAAGGRVEIVSGAGAPIMVPPAATLMGNDETVTTRVPGARSAFWFRVHVRDMKGQLILISNPIFVLPK